MPLNILRLNQRSAHPNDRIVFIKPLPGPGADVAEDFLKRIAAQCLPIMRDHHLSVTTLEEHEPNREFVGRNFNSGEVIQLVLRGRESGRWLPFGYVQMVMMHELAHCLQMNHSRAFWALRNTYASEMRGLWDKGYTGDGIWGRGRVLYDGQINGDAGLQGADVPEHLCGGTYRTRRGRKRKAKQDLSYQERKERRIRKKFGAGGEKLGEDELARRALEKNRWNPTKPRVAQSKRGRELRAAALLDRLEREQSDRQREQSDTPDDDEDDTDENEIETEDEEDGDGLDSIDHDGKHMVRVCADEDVADDANALSELAELRNLSDEKATKISAGSANETLPNEPSSKALSSISKGATKPPQANGPSAASLSKPSKNITTGLSSAHSANGSISTSSESPQTTPQPIQENHPASTESKPILKLRPEQLLFATQAAPLEHQSKQSEQLVCPTCSLANDQDALVCAACACVLDTDRLPRYWRCSSAVCRGGLYINAGDAGRCGVCGEVRPPGLF